MGLREAGHEVLVALNGTRALELCLQHQVEVLITDIFMPEKDGLEVIPEIRTALPQVKIIAVSGGAAMLHYDFLNVARILGAHHVLNKPFTLSEIGAALAELGLPTQIFSANCRAESIA